MAFDYLSLAHFVDLAVVVAVAVGEAFGLVVESCLVSHSVGSCLLLESVECFAVGSELLIG